MLMANKTIRELLLVFVTAAGTGFGFFVITAPNNPKKMVALKHEDRLVNICCITKYNVRPVLFEKQTTIQP